MKQLNIHYFEHVSFEGLGCIEDWVKTNNHKLTSTKFHESEDLPELNKLDWLIIMGGPMGIYDYEKYPYLKEEKVFIKKAIGAEKIVIGICLGAQLIGNLLGAKISVNPKKEIGWFDIRKTQLSNSLLVDLKDEFTAFHWHGDTFDIPTGAERLAESEACKNQAYLYKERVLGLQFHLEVTEETLTEMVKNGSHELQEDKYVQSAENITTNKEYIKTNNLIMFSLLNALEKRTNTLSIN